MRKHRRNTHRIRPLQEALLTGQGYENIISSEPVIQALVKWEGSHKVATESSKKKNTGTKSLGWLGKGEVLPGRGGGAQLDLGGASKP